MRISILKALGSLLTSLLAMVGNGPAPAAPPAQPVAAAAAAPVAAASASAAADRQIPQAVLDAVQFAYPVGVLDLGKTRKSEDDDATIYKVYLTNHGERYRLELDSAGAIREIKGELNPLDLPPAVIESVSRRFHLAATTTAREHVDVKGDRETKVFELVVVYQGRPLKVKVQPDGVIEDVDD